MEARLIDIGNSKGIRLSKKLIDTYGLAESIEITLLSGGLYIHKKEPTRTGWNEQMKAAIAAGDEPEDDVFSAMGNSWDDTDWTWPEEA